MKKNCLAILAFTLLAACSTGDDESFMQWTETNYNSADDNGLTMNDVFNGEFAISWMLDGEQLDTTRIQVLRGLNVLQPPTRWFCQQAFPNASTVVSTADDVTQIWGTHIRLTGYSDDNVYFVIGNTNYIQPVEADGQRMVYIVWFTPGKSTAVYNKTWDTWAAVTPVDSITVYDDSQLHRGTLVSTTRFVPAANLTFTSTQRTNTPDLGK